MSKPSEGRCACESHVSLGISHACDELLEWMTSSREEKWINDVSTAGWGRVKQIEGKAEH